MVHSKLSDITFLASRKHRSFALSSTYPCYVMSSFSETKLTKFMKDPDSIDDWITHNITHMR